MAASAPCACALHRPIPLIRKNTGRRGLQPLAATLAVAALCLALLPTPLHAHGPPTPLSFWGAFGRRVGRCQRIIGRSAGLCALRAWNAQRACTLKVLHGLPCDHDATEAAIEAARIDAVDAVGVGCTEPQALTLVFLGKFEAQQDVVRFCRDLEDAAVSAVFRPVAHTTAVPPVVRRCVESAAVATTKLLRRAFGSRQRLLDRIALLSFSPTKKEAMVAASSAAIGADRSGLEGVLTAACPLPAFAESYGRDAATFLATIASRADCLAGGTYAQGGVVCPPAQCGNGMLEPGEECDDGNVIDGDGCSAGCLPS